MSGGNETVSDHLKASEAMDALDPQAQHLCSIELTGAPGSGKTTVASELVQKSGFSNLTNVVAESGHQISDRLVGPLLRRTALPDSIAGSLIARSCDRSELLSEFLVAHPGLMGVMDSLTAHHKETPAAVLAVRWLFSLAYRWQLAAGARRPDTLVMAEGFAHRFLSFVDPTQEIPRGLLTTYLSATPRPCMLVFLDVDPCVTRKRLLLDERHAAGRSTWYSDGDPATFYSGMHRATALLADAAEELGWNVTRIVNNDINSSTSRIISEHARLPCRQTHFKGADDAACGARPERASKPAR